MTSHGESYSYHCATCGHDGKLPLWLVVDLGDRPDLAAAIRDGSIRRPPCEACGAQLPLSQALMVSRPDKPPPVLFYPDPGAPVTVEQQMEFFRMLLHRGQSSIPDERVATLPLEVLSLAVDRDIDEDLRQLRDGTLRALNPEMQRYVVWLNTLLAAEAQVRLRQAINQLTKASNTAELRSAFQSWPELLSDQADALLSTMIAIAEREQPAAGPDFRRRRLVVRQVRESGLDAVLPQDPG